MVALNILLATASLLSCYANWIMDDPVNGVVGMPEVVDLKGRSYANCQGRYEMSDRIFNGRPVWIRTKPDNKRFAFYNGDKRYAITGSQWLEAILKSKKKWHGYFVKAKHRSDDFVLTKWRGMVTDVVGMPEVVDLKGRSYANCQGRYVMSDRIFNGRPVWVRTIPDNKRFAFYNGDRRYAITGSQWLKRILKSRKKWHGSFVKAKNRGDHFVLTKWRGMRVMPILDVELKGRSYANCEGRYKMSKRVFNGRPVWIRTQPDDSRFAFFNTDKHYAITGSQWLESILKTKNKWHGYFVRAKYAGDKFVLTKWKGMRMNILKPVELKNTKMHFSDVVMLKGPSYADCAGLYKKSKRIFNGRPVWIRTQPDDSRFAFYNTDKHYAITGSQWLESILKTKNKWHGYFVKAKNAADNFVLTKWKSMKLRVPDVVLKGRSYASCQGRYKMSKRIFNGRPVWVRTQPDNKRFAFYNGDRRYAITGSQWLESILKSKRKLHGSFVKAKHRGDDFVLTKWKGMQLTLH